MYAAKSEASERHIKDKAATFILCYMGLIGLAVLSIAIDFELKQISFFSIGAFILVIVIGMRLLSVLNFQAFDKQKIAVHSESELRLIRKKLILRNMTIYVLILIILGVLCFILAPLLIGHTPRWSGSVWVSNSIFPLIGLIYLYFVTARSVVLVKEGEDNNENNHT
ncbi:hypothetical protein [Staphylococcus felis]|uniref:hypothetical protein n=1 Tax=Staphylococcus felis TaxID=46127 RepID=UPI0021D0C518|nr:hypothetical protein [Staphylococcus felis]UXR87276.1 hypothetical protein MUA17_02865 [Staphylococcus felis]